MELSCSTLVVLQPVSDRNAYISRLQVKKLLRKHLALLEPQIFHVVGLCLSIRLQ